MLRCQAGSISCAKCWVSMKSPRCRPPRSIKRAVSSISPRCWRMHPENGSRQIGRSVRSARRQPRIVWDRRSLMRGAMRCSPSSASPGRTTRDLDAPDLITPTNQPSATANLETGNLARQRNGRLNGGQRGRASTAVSRRDPQVPSNSAPLGPQASAELRDSLVAELNELGSSDDAATWAHRRLPEKNKLAPADAQTVEAAFAARLAVCAPADDERATKPRSAKPSIRRQRPKPGTRDNPLRSARKRRSEKIDKSVLTFPEPRRVRDRDHVRFVAKQPCLICGRQPADAHHVRFSQQVRRLVAK